MHNLEPVWRMEWSEAEGMYISTHELLGYKVIGTDGKVLGYGETKSDAIEAAYEALWPSVLQS